ncbi:MAG: exodeoxyribonuclease VII small subunit [Polyangiaceae bacterium]|nr:exodeoxyribonuclease VII small subunit [Polyangiaceae bacterium]
MIKKVKQPIHEDDVPFEESMEQLADIVEKLEGGDIPLNESVALFEKGMAIAKRSQAQLDRVEKKVEELLRVEDDGTPVTRPMSPMG